MSGETERSDTGSFSTGTNPGPANVEQDVIQDSRQETLLLLPERKKRTNQEKMEKTDH